MSYDLDDYQRNVERTFRPAPGVEPLTLREAALESALGCAEEAGEVAGLVKKICFQGKTPDLQTLEEELGDVLCYVSQLAHLMGISLSELAATNLRKIRRRYPEGRTADGGVR